MILQHGLAAGYQKLCLHVALPGWPLVSVSKLPNSPRVCRLIRGVLNEAVLVFVGKQAAPTRASGGARLRQWNSRDLYGFIN
jgi:hypothetical protein